MAEEWSQKDIEALLHSSTSTLGEEPEGGESLEKEMDEADGIINLTRVKVFSRPKKHVSRPHSVYRSPVVRNKIVYDPTKDGPKRVIEVPEGYSLVIPFRCFIDSHVRTIEYNPRNYKPNEELVIPPGYTLVVPSEHRDDLIKRNKEGLVIFK